MQAFGSWTADPEAERVLNHDPAVNARQQSGAAVAEAYRIVFAVRRMGDADGGGLYVQLQRRPDLRTERNLRPAFDALADSLRAVLPVLSGLALNATADVGGDMGQQEVRDAVALWGRNCAELTRIGR